MAASQLSECGRRWVRAPAAPLLRDSSTARAASTATFTPQRAVRSAARRGRRKERVGRLARLERVDEDVIDVPRRGGTSRREHECEPLGPEYAAEEVRNEEAAAWRPTARGGAAAH